MRRLVTWFDVAYDDAPRCRMDLYRPEDLVSAPLVLLIHGGGWQGGHRWQWAQACQLLAVEGFAAVTLGYRLYPDVGWPEMAHDVARAAAFVCANADVYGIDTSRAVTWGSSAGGHLALTLQNRGPIYAQQGVVGPLPEMIGVVAQCPATAMPLAGDGKIGADQASMILSEGIDPAEISPIAMDPAGFRNVQIIHGDADDVIALSSSQKFAKHVEKSGVAVDLRVIPGCGHGFGYSLTTPFGEKGFAWGLSHVRACLRDGGAEGSGQGI